MRIGIIGDAIDRQYAGIHYFTKNLVHSLTNIDNRNEYFLFKEKQSPNMGRTTQVVLSPSKWPFYRLYRLFRQLPKQSKKLNLDIVIEPAHFGPFNLPRHIKRVTVIHDLTPLLYPKWHPFFSGLLQKIFLPSITRRADLIVTNSNYTKADIINKLKIQPDKIVVSHLGLSSIFQPVDDHKTLGRYGIYKDYILYQGTIEPRKNLINLIKGYELYRHSNPYSDVQLIISGKQGWKSDNILRRKNESLYRDDIILLGYVKRQDMPALYTGSSLFIYPSFYEGFGMPIIEALACGAKVVASKFSSLPEVGGAYTDYFDPHDIHDICSSIERSIYSPIDSLEDQINYTKQYTWTNTARRILKALEELP